VELQDKIKALPEQKQIQLSPEERRILDLAKMDSGNIHRGVYLVGCRVSWTPQGSSNRVCFELKVFNGSVYPIRFDKIEGFITYDDRELKGKVDFYTGKWRLGTIEPRFHTYIELGQWLDDEEAVRIREDWEKKRFPYFSFKPLRIMICDGENAGRVAPEPLAFSGITAIRLDGKLN